MRQVRQALRALDGRYDERQSGFRGLLDLLHQGQREGWLKLHRDHKGVWRVFPVSAPSPDAPAGTESVPEEAVAVGAEAPLAPSETAPEAVPASESGAVVAGAAASAEILPPVAEESAPAEAAPARKGRRPRAAKSGSRAGQRRTPHRKPRGSTEA